MCIPPPCAWHVQLSVEVARAEHLTPIEERIKRLHDSMITVRDLQDQMRKQDETTHRVTRSTRSWRERRASGVRSIV